VRILLVEDEAPDMAALHRHVLGALPEAVVVEARTLREAQRAIQDEAFDLVVLDLMLQGDQSAGVQLVSMIRASGDSAIIVVSGLDVETYRPVMFTSQVWDYLEKPVDLASLRLLLQRVAQQRTAPTTMAPAGIMIADLIWTSALDNPKWKGMTISGLSLRERQVLWPLLERPNTVVKYAELFDASPNWGDHPSNLKAALSQMISKIRRQFEGVDPDFDCIQASPSHGYSWRVSRDS